MSAPDFESILDACLTEVTAGRGSVEECTAVSMQELRLPVAESDPARRARLMTAIASAPRQRRRLAFPRPSSRRLLGAGAVAVPAAAIAAVALLLVAGRMGGGSAADAATLTTFTGAVERADGASWQPLADNDQVTEGDQLRTSADGSAVLTFADGTSVTLDPSTEVVIERSRVRDRLQIELRQLRGRVWNNVAPDAPGQTSYVVRTADATMTAHGTVFETAVAEDETTVNAAEGSVEVESGGERVILAAGETLRARLGMRLPLPTLRPQTGDNGVQITGDGPFVLSLISPRGLATGARPDGLLYHQIPRTLTSNPAVGPQRILMLIPLEGVYTLIVRRAGDGSGSVLIEAGGEDQRIPLPALGSALAVKLRVSVAGGQVSVTMESIAPFDPRRFDSIERLIVTDRIRMRAAALREQLQQRRKDQTDGPPIIVPTRPAR